MGRILYVVQSFSRPAGTALAWDAPAYSGDRRFAAALAARLARRKAGVVTVGAALDEAGRLAEEAEILGGFGMVPTAIILPAAYPPGDEALDRDPAARLRRFA